MKARVLLAVAMSLLLVASVVATGIADGTLVITPKTSTVVYPRPAHLTITVPSAVEETITVEVRPVGGDWRLFKSIPATEAALATTFTVNPKLRMTSGIRATQGALVSDVVTVSVQAKLTATRVVRHRSTYRVYGIVSPGHIAGTTIGVHVWKKTGKGASVVLTPLPDIEGQVYRGNAQVAVWRAAFVPPEKGVYVVRAFHEDEGHVLSVSKTRTFRAKR